MKLYFPFSNPLIVLPTKSLMAPLKTPPPPQWYPWHLRPPNVFAPERTACSMPDVKPPTP